MIIGEPLFWSDCEGFKGYTEADFEDNESVVADAEWKEVEEPLLIEKTKED